MATYDLSDEHVFLIRTLTKYLVTATEPDMVLDANKLNTLASIIDDANERQQFLNVINQAAQTNNTITLPAPPVVRFTP